jgi:hypothetical protein
MSKKKILNKEYLDILLNNINDIKILSETQQNEINNMKIVNETQQKEINNMKTVNETQQNEINNMKTVNETQQKEINNMKTVNETQQNEINNMKTVNETQQNEISNMKTVNETQQNKINEIKLLNIIQKNVNTKIRTKINRLDIENTLLNNNKNNNNISKYKYFINKQIFTSKFDILVERYNLIIKTQYYLKFVDYITSKKIENNIFDKMLNNYNNTFWYIDRNHIMKLKILFLNIALINKCINNFTSYIFIQNILLYFDGKLKCNPTSFDKFINNLSNQIDEKTFTERNNNDKELLYYNNIENEKYTIRKQIIIFTELNKILLQIMLDDCMITSVDLLLTNIECDIKLFLKIDKRKLNVDNFTNKEINKLSSLLF